MQPEAGPGELLVTKRGTAGAVGRMKAGRRGGEKNCVAQRRVSLTSEPRFSPGSDWSLPPLSPRDPRCTVKAVVTESDRDVKHDVETRCTDGWHASDYP